MARAKYEILGEDGSYLGRIPGLRGVIANAGTLEACRKQLQEVLEEWILVRLALHLLLPAVGGVSLKIKSLRNVA